MAIAAEAVGRPAGDILSRVVRIRLSGQEFVLPVRSIRFNREWKAGLEAQSAGVIDELTSAGNDWERIAGVLVQDIEPYIDFLVSYAPDVLTRDAIEEMEPDPSMDVITACREVWLAATPLAAIAIGNMKAQIETMLASDGLPLTSSQPPSTDGDPTTWRIDSPTNSSSGTTTLPTTGIETGARRTSTNGSSQSEPEPSSPTTARPSRSGTGRGKAAKARRNGASQGKPSRRLS